MTISIEQIALPKEDAYLQCMAIFNMVQGNDRKYELMGVMDGEDKKLVSLHQYMIGGDRHTIAFHYRQNKDKVRVGEILLIFKDIYKFKTAIIERHEVLCPRIKYWESFIQKLEESKGDMACEK